MKKREGRIFGQWFAYLRQCSGWQQQSNRIANYNSIEPTHFTQIKQQKLYFMRDTL